LAIRHRDHNSLQFPSQSFCIHHHSMYLDDTDRTFAQLQLIFSHPRADGSLCSRYILKLLVRWTNPLLKGRVQGFFPVM
jgi:hypothetical protein